MKTRVNYIPAIAKLWAMLLVKVVGSFYAFQYCRAAQHDERNGFPFTAAMEWRKAAELFAPVAPLADHCWHQWERIMHLPRRLAEPLVVTPMVQSVSQSNSRIARKIATPPEIHAEVSLVAAA